MVAAWISADTGVGPSIASGSQVCSGNWADLPTTPASRSRAAASTVPARQPVGAAASTSGIEVVPVAASSRTTAEQHAEVADPGHEEGLDRGGAGRRPLAVVADEQVGAGAHDLPADQEQDEVVGVDDESSSRR